MRRREILSIAMAGVLIAVAGAVVTGTTAVAAAPSAIVWEPCPEQKTFDCASITVPVNWKDPFGPTLDLALARSKATDPARRIGSLVINPGGPGGSGVNFVMRNPPFFSADVRAQFDIVGFDPRGMHRSSPVRCDQDLQDAQAALQYPESQSEFDDLKKVNDLLGNNCLALNGTLVEHMDTASVARDVEAIRVALNEGKLNYFGGSYGTLIGQQYAELFPGNIRVMSLHAIIDHSLAVEEYEVTSAKEAEEAFAQFADWCERTPACALHGRDVETFFDKLYARAESGEVAVSPETLLDTVQAGMSNPLNAWFGLAEQLLAWDAGAQTSGPLSRPSRGEPANYFYYPVLCEDFDLSVASFTELMRLRERLAKLAPHMRLNTLAWTDLTGCLNWPTELSNPQHPPHIVGAPPIMMAAGRYDPATPYSWATNVASQIGSGATLLTYDGVGHALYAISPCVRSATDRYLATTQPPPPNTHCPAIFPTQP